MRIGKAVLLLLLKLLRTMEPFKRFVVVESPYAGDVDRNVLYARAAIVDCLERDEVPYASHLLFTQDGILDDDKPEQRLKGILCGFSWGMVAPKRVFYEDYGRSGGMMMALEEARAWGQVVEYRRLYDE